MRRKVCQRPDRYRSPRSAAVGSRVRNVCHRSRRLFGAVAVLLLAGAGTVRPPAARHDLEPWRNGVPEGWIRVEGDILIPAGEGTTAAAYTTILWGDGVVPFEFDGDGNDSVSAAHRTVMLNAMAQWTGAAAITFRARQLFDTGWLHIRDSNNDTDPSNSAPVGAGVGERTVNIADWDVWICTHELGHALGFWHEQSRPNRDNFVRINWGRIADESAHNFEVHSDAHQYPRGGYDFDSIMHYDQCAFSTCSSCSTNLGSCRTITVLSPWDTDWQGDIGQRDHLSTFDELTMSFMYPESDWRFVDGSYTGFFENGTLWEPYKTYSKGRTEVPSGGTIWIQPGSYSTGGIITKPMTLRAPVGGVVLQE